MAFFLAITDGPETATIDNVNYALAEGGFAPAISFDDSPVTETLVINILDGGAGTLAAVRANAEKLQRILRNARRHGLGSWRGICTISYATDSATSPTPFALLVDAEPLVLPTNTNDLFLPGSGASTSIDGVVVTVTRRGTWLGALDATAASAAATNPTVQSITFSPAALTPAPLRIALGALNGTNMPALYPGLILVTDAVNRIGLGVGAAGPATYTLVADAAAKAYGGNVMRYTPTTTDEVFTNTLPAGAVPGSGPYRVAVWASVRNNGSDTYRVRAAITDTQSVQRLTEGVLVDASTANPRWVYLGSIAASVGAASAKIGIKASGTGSSLDINSIAMLDITNNEVSRAIVHNEIVTHGNTGSMQLIVGTRADTMLTPEIRLDGSPNSFGLSRLGNANLLTAGTTVAAVWLATYTTFWVHVNTGAGNAITTTELDGARLLASQTPG